MTNASLPQLDAPSRWFRQLLAVIHLDLRRHLFSLRGMGVLLLALAPTGIIAIHALHAHWTGVRCALGQDVKLMAWVLSVLQLRIVLYFGMLGLVVQSIRGERVDKTLFYWLVAPVRRDALVVGKFLACTLGGFFLFAMGVLSSMALFVLHHGVEGSDYLWHGPGLTQLSAYLGLTFLACVGYGAVFLVLSQRFPNPVLAALAYFGWESVSAALPKLLQLLSVTFYLKPLFPVELPVVGISGLLTAVVEPIPSSYAVLGLLLVSAVAVTVVARGFRRAQLDTTD
jgi:ABC-type transport system involved in multi-copper enzyme maturation permease subunit